MESSVTFHTFVGLFVFFDTFQVMKDKAALELYQWKNELLYGPLPVGEEVRGGGVYLYPAAAERTDAAQGGGGDYIGNGVSARVVPGLKQNSNDQVKDSVNIRLSRVRVHRVC